MARPIETAPKNGKVIFLADDDHGIFLAAFWHPPLGWMRVDGGGSATTLSFTPTRWGESIDDFERD